MFDDQGLTAIDRRLREKLTDQMALNRDEKRALTTWLSKWHKDWKAVVNHAQKDFNKMRRMECADEHGFCTCVSTGDYQHHTKMDAGHFVGAERQITRFDRNNVWPQTKKANNHKHGDDAKINYTLWMVKEFDVEFIRDLQIKSRTKYSWKDNQESLFAHRIQWLRGIKKQETRLCRN